MSIAQLQFTLAMVSYGKLIVLIAFYGLQGIGIVSHITSLITLLSIVAQFYNNQGVQIEYMRSNPKLIDTYKTAMSSITFLVGILALFVLCITSFFGFIRVPFEYIPLIGLAIIVAIQNGAFDFYCTVNNKVDSYLKSQIYGSIAFLIAVLLFYICRIEENNLVVLYPIQLVVSFLCYRIFLKNILIVKYRISRIKSLKKYYILQKRHLILNVIPLTAVLTDYILKNTFIAASGPVLVGQLQILQSIDSLIGNIFAGPIYKKAIYDYTKNKFIEIDKRFGGYLISLFWPLFIICVPILLLAYVEPPELLINYEKFNLIKGFTCALIIFLTSKYFTLVWGLIGQVLLTNSKNYAVAYCEVGFRITLAALTLLFFIIAKPNINSYLYAYVVSSIGLLGLGLKLISRK